MINPFEHHPENKKLLKNKSEPTTIKIKEIEVIFNNKIDEINKTNTPTWGYSRENIFNLLNQLLGDIRSN